MKQVLRFLTLAALICVPWVTQAQDIADYTFSTGTDANQWITLSGSATELLSSSKDDNASSITNIGFTFPFGDNSYTQFWVSSNGVFSFSSSTSTSGSAGQFTSSYLSNAQPKICGVARDLTTGSDGYVKYELTGTAPNRVLVCEFFTTNSYIYGYSSTAATCKWQVQLHESDSKVVIIYGAIPSSSPSSYQIGLSQSTSDIWTVNPSTHEATHATGAVSTTYSVWPGENRYYAFERPVFTCPKPTLSDVAPADIEPRSATIRWTPADASQTLFDIYWSPTNTAPTDATVPGVANRSDDSYEITGLTPATTYYVWIRGNCGTASEPDVSGGWTLAKSFATGCEAISTFPWSTNFDSYTGTTSSTTNNLPLCWNYINTSSGNSYPIIYNSSSDAHSGSNYLRFYNYSGSSYADEYAILPEMDGISGLRMKLYARAYSSYNATFHVGVMTDPTNTTTFVEIGNYTPTTTTYELYTIPFNTYTGSGKYIAIKVEKPTSSSRYVYIDDITVEEIPNCIEPSALAEVPNTATPNSLTFNWTAGGSETTWKLQYKKSSEEEWTTLASPVTTIPYTLEGLDASTAYNVRVAAWCNPSNPEAISSYSEAATATTACEAFTAPWTENFESLTAGTVPICWNNSSTTGTDYSSNPHYYWGVYEYSSNKMLRMYNFLAHGPNAIINSPTITLPSEGTYQLTFDYSHTASCGAFYVKISTDNGASFVDLQSYTKVGTSSSNSDPGTFTEANPISLADYAGQSIILQFYAEPNYGSGAIFVDNISVGLAPTCNKPTGLAKANVAAHQVDLSWTKGDAETDWDICINVNEGALVSIDESDATVTGSSVSYTLTDLDPETAYTVKVRANCGGGNDVSQWSNEVSFTTTVACPAPTSPSNHDITAHTATLKWFGNAASSNYEVKYRTAAGVDLNTSVLDEDFTGLTSGIPTGWDNSEGTTTTSSYKWNYYNSGHDAAPCVRFNSYNNSDGNTNFLKTPAMDFPAGETMTLTFWWKNPAGDDFSVYISTDGGTTQTLLKTGMTGQSSWKQESISLSDYVGATNVTIHFKGTSNYGSGDAYIYLDDIVIGEEIPAGEWQTVAPANITVTPGTYVGAASLSGLLAETKYEAYVRTDCNAAGDGYSTTQLDFTPFTTLAGNQKPTGVSVDPVTLSSSTATVSWTGNGCSDHHVSYDVYYATSDVAAVPATPTAPNLIAGVTETSKTITGLDPTTEYNVWVRDNCGTDGVSEWTAAVTFTTLAACPQPTAVAVSNIGTHVADVEWTGIPEYTVKYRKSAYVDGIEETFGTSLPSGWENKTGLLSAVMGGTALASGSQWSFGTSNGVFDNHARINIYGNGYSEHKGWLITPTFTLPAGATMSFDLALTAYSGTLDAPATNGTDDRFVVLVYSDDAWHILREWNNSGSPYVYNDIPNTAAGETVDDIDISDYVGKNVKFAFYGESTENNADNNLHIDNVTIGTSVPAGSWLTIEDVDANSITLTGLDAGTKYDVVIEPECNTTLASDPVSFTTVALPTLDITANSWYAIASPVHNSGNDETVAGVNNLTSGTYDFLRWNEGSNKWESQKTGTNHTGFNTLEQGRGYIYRNEAGKTLTFDGEPNTGNVVVNVTKTADGWNLIGNPYMAQYTPTTNFYILNTNGMWVAKTQSYSNKVKVGEAFLVKVSTAGTYNFTAPAKKSAPASTIAFTVSNDEFTDIAYARFSSEEGLPKISHLNPEAPMLSIDGYAIANLNEGTESFPMSFSGQGSYTLTVSGNTDVTGYLHLVDRLTGRDIDLLSTPSYSFTGSPVSDRFIVKLTPDANEGSSTTRFAIFDGNSLIVNGEGTLEVYDVMGRRLMSAEVTGSEYRIPGSDLHTGVYVLRMNGNSQKIVIK